MNEITTSMLIADQLGRPGLSATALIAIPILVWWTVNWRATMRTAATTITITWLHRDDEAAQPRGTRAGKIGGKALGVAPKTSWPVYSRNRDTPIAVMSTFSAGPPRSGR